MATPHEELRLLSIFHYVLAGVEALFSLFPLIYVGLGIAFISGALDQGRHPPPGWFGWVFVGIGSLFTALGLTGATLTLLAGRALAARRRHTYCVVVAALNCMFAPFGTILGIFTLISLQKPEVRFLFGLAVPAWPPPPPWWGQPPPPWWGQPPPGPPPPPPGAGA